MWKQAQSLFSQEEQSDDDDLQDNLLDETDNLCNLSPTQRLYGFGACSLAGVFCMFLMCNSKITYLTEHLVDKQAYPLGLLVVTVKFSPTHKEHTFM
uniref:Vesicle transport protein SFT2B n=1 Tax=Tanacetum cinerariifolium TaxID=118510 RepID=A0A6L2P3I0_TANCI|nr:vesicle transport protein SFT2B [Tanacetum cinerariifolium]